jgi:hypothetical protein
MTEIERDLLNSLAELEQAVQAMPAANPKPDLMALFSRIDALTAQLPPGTSPQLLHFLQNKSYGKARLWLEEREHFA